MATHSVLAACSQLHMAPADVFAVVDPDRPLQLAQLAGQGRALVATTGIAMGPIVLHVSDSPGVVDGGHGHWEERHELDMSITEPLYLTAPTLEDAGPPEPVYVPRVPGPHTVTLLARGRASRPDDTLDPEEPACEEYLVAFCARSGRAGVDGVGAPEYRPAPRCGPTRGARLGGQARSTARRRRGARPRHVLGQRLRDVC